MVKKIVIDKHNLALFNKAFLEKLFPKPYNSDILFEENDRYIDFYFSEEYYIKLIACVNQDDINNKFNETNDTTVWINLKKQLKNFKNVIKVPLNCSTYPFVENTEYSVFFNEKKEINLKKLEIHNIHLIYRNALNEINALYNKTKVLYMKSLLNLICKENKVVTYFDSLMFERVKYIGVIKVDDKYYLVDENNIYHDMIYDDNLISAIENLSK